MSIRSFLKADVDDLISKLNVNEKISLLSAPNWWNTNRVDRLEIPSLRMSDGPNGVRGSSHFLSHPAQCIPCATSLAATFDTDLIYQVGQFLATESKLKSAAVLLAPTCNIQRNPLGGRAFESFSEDPHLSGMMAAAYVNGLQSKGVAATIKHFVANDQEHERTATNSVVSERALREVYLYPFMLAQKYAKPWAFMTSYGRVDDIHCAENHRLLQSVLREEWGFDGLVMSDWFGTYSVAEALNAGLDLEMPGPPRWRTPVLVTHMLSSRKLFPDVLDKRAKTILTFVQRVAKVSPEVVYGDDGMVLLKNDDKVLPLASTARKIAIIGPNAKGRVISGGGSAYLKATYIVSPWTGIQNASPKGTELNFSVGCYAHKYLPTLEDKLTTPDGQSTGWLAVFYNQDADENPTNEVARFTLQDTRVKLNDFLPPGLGEKWTMKLSGKLIHDATAPFELGLTVSGRAKLYINGKMTIDNWTKQRPGEFFYGQGSVEEKATIDVVQGKEVVVLVEYINTPPPNAGDRDLSQPALMLGVRLGGAEKIDPNQALEDAVTLAEKSDVAIVVIGLTHEWESEGFDRPSLALPGRQTELICRVAEANRNTVVIVQSGSAVDYSWSSNVSGIIQAWYSGNEVGNAIADVLFGAVNPSGRMPLSFPKRDEDNPAWFNTTSENGKIHYREDIYVGYKSYQARKIEPQWAFGSGLSYTTFAFSHAQASLKLISDNTDVDASVSVLVKNTGELLGRAVLQLYIGSSSNSKIQHPASQLRAFTKTKSLAPGEEVRANLRLEKFSFAFWDEPKHGWTIYPGAYQWHLGASSEDIVASGELKVENMIFWKGL